LVFPPESDQIRSIHGGPARIRKASGLRKVFTKAVAPSRD
jgi:hypothetical protein